MTLIPGFLPVAAGLALCLLPAGAAAGPGAPAGRHGVLECADCHPGGGPEARDCPSCHEASDNLHPAGVRPSLPVPAPYPLEEGRVTCSTCHRLHEPTGPHALRGFAEGMASDLKEFCVTCHGETLGEKSPHRAESGPNRCAFCHASLDLRRVLAGGSAAPRAGADRLCDFCHDVRSKDHPRNIDPVLALPSTLPRGPAGEVHCATCHNPHGSSEFTHYIREEYARHFERGRQDNPHRDDRRACGACHVESAPERISAEAPDLRFQGDAILLCISCHVTARSHHPVGTPLPAEMASRLSERGGLPLDPSGRLACVTCHTNNCSSDRQHMSVRHYDPARMTLDLCWFCHPREEFARIDPHRKSVEDTADGCVFCHDRPPVKGLERSEDLYFVSQVKMICLRCHEGLSDQDVSHMGKAPTPEVLARLAVFAEERATQFPLDREGRLTCTTCHNAHFSAKDARHRTRLGSREMCALCHLR